MGLKKEIIGFAIGATIAIVGIIFFYNFEVAHAHDDDGSLEPIKVKRYIYKDGEQTFNLAEAYFSDDKLTGTKADKEHAKKLYKKACNEGYGEACYKYAQIIENKNRKTGVEYYEKGCNTKTAFAKSCYQSFMIYTYSFKSYGVNKDIEKAKEYSKKTCSLDAHYHICEDKK